MMRLISDINELEANLERFDSGRKSKNPNYLQLLKDGNCFVPYVRGGVLAFAPSRFSGYVGNNYNKHIKARDNKEIAGYETNDSIEKCLGHPPREHKALNKIYKEFCMNMGVVPSKNKKTFWLTPEAINFIEDKIVEEISKSSSAKQIKTSTQAVIDARIGQGKFRRDLLAYWGKKCALTGCKTEKILRASHIKPWRDSNNSEKLDQFNGLLLAPNADALFDNGLITFEKSGKIKISSKLTKVECKHLGINPQSKIRLEKKHQRYLEYHRKEVFEKFIVKKSKGRT